MGLGFMVFGLEGLGRERLGYFVFNFLGSDF